MMANRCELTVAAGLICVEFDTYHWLRTTDSINPSLTLQKSAGWGKGLCQMQTREGGVKTTDFCRCPLGMAPNTTKADTKQRRYNTK